MSQRGKEGLWGGGPSAYKSQPNMEMHHAHRGANTEKRGPLPKAFSQLPLNLLLRYGTRSVPLSLYLPQMNSEIQHQNFL